MKTRHDDIIRIAVDQGTDYARQSGAAVPVASGRSTAVAQRPLQSDTNPMIDLALLDAVKLTVPKAAKRMGIGETKLRSIIQNGEMPVLRIGGKMIVVEQDIVKFLMGNYGRVGVPDHRPAGRPALPSRIRDSAMLVKGG